MYETPLLWLLTTVFSFLSFELYACDDDALVTKLFPLNIRPEPPPSAPTSVLNIKMQSVWVMLRKCCNHPYLLEFPLTKDGQLRIDEDVVTKCGKMLLLDRMLPVLLHRGHKARQLYLFLLRANIHSLAKVW